MLAVSRGRTSQLGRSRLEAGGGSRLAHAAGQGVFALDEDLVLHHLDVVRQLLPPHDGASWSVGLAFTPDSKRLFSCGADGWIRLWDVESGRLVLSIDVGAPLRGLAVSSDGRFLAAGRHTAEPALLVWEVKRKR